MQVTENFTNSPQLFCFLFFSFESLNPIYRQSPLSPGRAPSHSVVFNALWDASEKEVSFEVSEYKDKFQAVLYLTNDADYYVMQARHVYNNFWQAPLPARIVIIDQLLMSPEEKYYSAKEAAGAGPEREGKDAAYRKAFDYVANKLLPEGMQYSAQARVALGAYNNVLPPNQRALFLSAMLAANDAANRSSKPSSVGERLAVIFEFMGPGEIKFGQALSNYPDAPMDLRQPMVRLMKDANPSARWDLWRSYDDIVPDEYKANMKRMGKRQGKGAFQESIVFERQDGSESVLKWQEAYAEKRARAGFERIRAFIKELHRVGGLEPGIAEAIEVIARQAQEMVAKETDVDYRAAQVKQAHKYYDPLLIKIDDSDIPFKTADWYAYGVTRDKTGGFIGAWCDEQKMAGVHFDELPATNPAERAQKKEIAMATIAAEFGILLLGWPIDNDRHIAQLRIDGKNPGLFDHGALDLSPPSKRDKQILAELLVSITAKYNQGDPLPQLFHNELKELKTRHGGVIPDYLIRVERGVLALAPFFEELEANDLKEIIAAVKYAKDVAGKIKIDEDIRRTKVKGHFPNLPFIALRVSTLLDRALPPERDIGIHVERRMEVRYQEPARYDYVRKTEIGHPTFPWIQSDQPSPRTGVDPQDGEDGISRLQAYRASSHAEKVGLPVQRVAPGPISHGMVSTKRRKSRLS